MAKRILVVDDDPDIRATLEVILTKAGYEVLHAADGKEAEARLAAEKIDLVMLDVMMESDTRGFHLAYAISKDPRLRKLPIIMLTGVEEKSGLRIEPEKSGDFLPVDAYLRKPVDVEQLKATLAKLLA